MSKRPGPPSLGGGERSEQGVVLPLQVENEIIPSLSDFCLPKESAAHSSAPRARPGIHIFSRAEVHKEVRPGIQGQVEMAEPPPAYNRFQLTCGPKALYKKWPLSDFEAATTPIPESRLPDNAKSSKTTGLSNFQRIEFKY